MEGSLSRILVVDRGAQGRRRIDLWKKRGMETVLAFGAAEADASWVDDADYAVYSKAAVGELPKPEVIIEQAMDAGCDAVDAGPLIDDIDLLDLAVKANLALVGCDIHTVAKYRDAEWIRERATEVGVPAAPWTEGTPLTLRRVVDSVVLVDRHGGVFDLGTIERTLGPSGSAAWLLEHGQVLGP
ncbi:MAG: hypothetical protein GWP91_08780, partial [Rhodobacterales bacterium]|nr:hypothetical protein [Rhodobacterales bacterium]